MTIDEQFQQLLNELANARKLVKEMASSYQTACDELVENYEKIYNENCKLREEHNISDISLLDENEKLKSSISDYVNVVLHDRKEIDRLNNIMKEARKYIYKNKEGTDYSGDRIIYLDEEQIEELLKILGDDENGNN